LTIKKYWFVYTLYWQEGLALRASFFMERFRALVVLISLYYLWTALLRNQSSFAGYTETQMLTYIFGMSALRSLVFATRAEEIPAEINQGRLSGYLLKPVNYFVYTFSRDLSEKSTNFISSLLEITGLFLLFGITLQWPAQGVTWLLLIPAVAGAIVLNFLLSFIVGCWSFWTSESSGPRFLLAMTIEFTAGGFFPLDIFPQRVQDILAWLPSPYMIFFPMNLMLEKIDSAQIIKGFCIQYLWILGLALFARWIWKRGVRTYGAEGA